MWQARIRNAALAAGARLGDADATEILRRRLDKALPSRLPFERANELAEVIKLAGFSGDMRFSLLLCPYLGAPASQPRGHELPMDVRAEAARALAAVTGGAPPDLEETDVEAWKRRCKRGMKERERYGEQPIFPTPEG